MPYINIYRERVKSTCPDTFADVYSVDFRNSAIERDLYAHDTQEEAVWDIAESHNPCYLYTIFIQADCSFIKFNLEEEAEAYKKRQAIEQKDYDDYVAEVSSPYLSGR